MGHIDGFRVQALAALRMTQVAAPIRKRLAPRSEVRAGVRGVRKI
jgi:hypothetical protein